MIFSVLLAALATAAPSASPLPTPQSLPVVTLHTPKTALHVQVARTEDQRERGLMSVTALRRHTGMVFVFDSDGPVAFWMKDTLIPLDMVFIGTDGTVRQVDANVAIVPVDMPDNQIPLEQGRAKYVIELPAREAAADGLHAGVRVGGLPK